MSFLCQVDKNVCDGIKYSSVDNSLCKQIIDQDKNFPVSIQFSEGNYSSVRSKLEPTHNYLLILETCRICILYRSYLSKN